MIYKIKEYFRLRKLYRQTSKRFRRIFSFKEWVKVIKDDDCL